MVNGKAGFEQFGQPLLLRFCISAVSNSRLGSQPRIVASYRPKVKVLNARHSGDFVH
jgi:hypothetical protein